MKAPLTDFEKKRRGTFQSTRARVPRTLDAIQADISEAQETLASLRYTAREASKGIQKLGVTVPSGRGSNPGVKANPCIRIQGWALTAAKSIRRELAFLNEELELAAAAKTLEDDDEFAGL